MFRPGNPSSFGELPILIHLAAAHKLLIPIPAYHQSEPKRILLRRFRQSIHSVLDLAPVLAHISPVSAVHSMAKAPLACPLVSH